jgi:hypothetical protein
MLKQFSNLTVWFRMSLLSLLLVSTQCFAAPAKDISRDECLSQAAQSPQRIQAEEQGGRLGANEFFIEKCGPREVQLDRMGKRVLSTSDCAELYGWALSGTCVEDSLANYQLEVIKQLDPFVFDMSRYTLACKKLVSNKASEDDFRVSVCVEPSVRTRKLLKRK